MQTSGGKVLGGGNGQCKGPQAETCLGDLRNNEETSVMEGGGEQNGRRTDFQMLAPQLSS